MYLFNKAFIFICIVVYYIVNGSDYHANYLINVLRVNKKLNLSYFGAPTTGPIRHNLSPYGSRNRAR